MLGAAATERAEAATAFLRQAVAAAPAVGLILGSGLGGMAELIQDERVVPFEAIPFFPVPSAPGHRGALSFGSLAGQPVAVVIGRVHPYEGLPPSEAALPVRVLRRLGIHTLILTNAAGGLRPGLPDGTIVAIADHLCFPALSGQSPLTGWRDPSAFVDMRDAYDPALRRLAVEVAGSLSIGVQEGVYAMVGGPSYETPAEKELLRRLGADMVGMSTAHEVIVARHEGLRVLGFSVITNAGDEEVSHGSVLRTAEAATQDLGRLLSGLLPLLARGRH